MAVVYYPQDQLLYSKDTSQGNYTALVLSSTPNVVLYFGTASNPSSASALDLPITASWARSASISLTYVTATSASWATQSMSASFADTASFALNANASPSASWASSSISASVALTASIIGGQYPYTTVTTNSLWWITCSFENTDQFIGLTTASVYYFTSSNMPDVGNTSNTSLFLSHSAPYTSSLVFPSTWYWLGTAPSYISSSKVAVITLKAFGPQLVVGAYSVQY